MGGVILNPPRTGLHEAVPAPAEQEDPAADKEHIRGRAEVELRGRDEADQDSRERREEADAAEQGRPV